MTTSFHLTVIAKQPVPGRVKTRLVPPLNHAQAAQIAAACLADTFEAVLALRSRYDDIAPTALIDGEPGGWIPPGVEIHRQRGGDLAERLANGFDDLGPGLIIGMDTPSCGQWFDAAFTALRAGEDALGMTHDGGYWGIALASTDRRVFDQVPMSVDDTGAAQLRQLHRLGRRVRMLPTVHDLDGFADVAPLVAELPGSNLASVVATLIGPAWG